MQEVEELCDEVIIVDKGSIIAQDTPQKLAQSLFQQYTLSIVCSELTDLFLSELRELLSQNRGSVEVSEQEDGKELLIRSVEDMTVQVVALLHRHQLSMLKLQTEQPKLEDVVLHLAGRKSA
jgi:ABC-2 type transport system ATP-binding protein